MKIVKNYNDFSNGYRLNENLLKNLWDKVVNYFNRNFGKNAWVYYAMYLQEKGELVNKKSNKVMVEIIVPPSYLENIKKGLKGVSGDNIESEMKGKFKDHEKVQSEEDIENKDIANKLKSKVMKSNFSDKEKEMSDEELEKAVDEAYAPLTWPLEPGETEEVVRNVDVGKLKKRIERVYKMNLLRAERHKKDNYSEDSKFIRKKTHALFIWGAPGVGKTEILHQVAKAFDLVVQEWHLSQIEPTDFRGVPKIENIKGTDDPKDERTVSKLPAIFPTSDGLNGNGGIMFFDELNRAPEMVLSASLSLALSGKHGEYELPPRWIVIAAGNRPSDLQTSQQLTDDPILWNRFGHVNYAPAVEDWVEWALGQPQINPDLVAFLQFHKQFFHRYDPESKRANWPSPRMWAMASEKEFFLRKESWNNKLSEKAIKDCYTDAVGLDAAIDFVEYLKLKEYYNEKDVQEVYDKGAAAKRPPTRQDQARAAACSIAFWVRDRKISLQEMKNVLDFSLSLPNVESRTSLAVFLRLAHPYIKTDEPYKTVYYDFLKKWHIKLTEEL